MIILNNCLTCETEINGKDWCSICEILIPEITDYSLETIPNKKNSESVSYTHLTLPTILLV